MRLSAADGRSESAALSDWPIAASTEFRRRAIGDRISRMQMISRTIAMNQREQICVHR